MQAPRGIAIPRGGCSIAELKALTGRRIHAAEGLAEPGLRITLELVI